MVLANTAGVTKVFPVNIGVPPVGVVYQLNTVPGVVELAVMVPVVPILTDCVGGLTLTSGITIGVTVTGTTVLSGDTQLPNDASA